MKPRIGEILRGIPPLALLEEEVIEEAARRVELLRFKVGEVILREGSEGEDFFVIYSGRVRAVTLAPTGEEITLATLERGDYFGEVSALKGTKRTVTVRAAEETTILRLSGSDFKGLLTRNPEIRKIFEWNLNTYGIRQFLRRFTVFGAVPARILNAILDRFESRMVDAGEVVLSQDDPGDEFFVIRSGRFDVERDGRKVNVLTEGESFGEIALLAPVPRVATVRAATNGELLVLGREAFDEVLEAAPRMRERLVRAISAYDPVIALDRLVSSRTSSTAAGPETAGGPEIPGAPEAESGPVSERDITPGGPSIPGVQSPPVSGLRRLLPFPFVQQQDESDCGAACLSMISRFYGKRLSLSRLRDLANVTTSGASMASLAVAGEAMGFSTRGIRTSSEKLSAITLPAICHWQGNHFVVLWKITGRYAVIGDPAIGRKRIPIEEFERSWTGFVLEMRPTEIFLDIRQAKTKVKRFLPLLKPFLFILGEVFLCSLLLDIFGLAQPLFTQVVIDKVFVHGARGLLNAMLVGMVLIAILQSATSALRRLLLVHISTRIDLKLITDFLRHLMRLSQKYFDVRRVGDIMARVDENETVTQAFIGTIPTALLDVLTASIYVAIMLIYSVKLTILVLIFVVPFAILTLGFTPIIRANRREVFQRHADASSMLIETMGGVSTVKALSIETPMRWKWENLYCKAILETRRGAHIDIVQETIARLLSTVSGTFLFWWGATMVLDGELSLGQLFAFNVLVANVMTPLLGLVGVWDQLQAIKISLDRLNDVFDSDPEQSAERTYLVLPRIAGHIRFENVSFRYQAGRGKPVLNKVSLEIPAGATAAIVGRSGSGKTTIARLIMRFYDPEEGRIMIDGHDLKTFQLSNMRRAIGIVPQDVQLFSGSIRDNIAAGDIEVSFEKVVNAAQMAGAHDFITEFPLAYDTPIGERGTSLSGGQRQRIAIARAVLRDPAILLMDEATSALDTESERAIQRNLDTISSGRTTILIAHRLSTVQKADIIFVMDQGTMVEIGSHRELMEKGGLYSYLVTQQLPT